MRVLVTGSEGYIGTVLVPMLSAAGHEAVGLDTGFFREGHLVPGSPPPPVTIRRDVRDVREADLDGVEAIIHLAALSNDPLGEIDPELTLEINHRATARLADLARAAGARRFVLASSCSIYGAAGGHEVAEDHPMDPRTAYARSKVLCERDLLALGDERFTPVVMRNATAYGISPRMRFDVVVNNLCGWAHTTGEVRLASDGSAWRPLVHVEDLAAAAIAALTAPRDLVHGQAFNIGRTGENYQVRTIAGSVARAFPGSRVAFAGPAADDRSYHVSFRKAEERLEGYRPRWRMEDGIRQCADTFRAIGLTRETFEDRLYTRLRQLKHLMATGEVGADLHWRAPAGSGRPAPSSVPSR
jgi:nucleoside-diphosphate-sugar epimerase